jgi:hypothetical protein
MTEKITNKISFDVPDNVLFLAFFSGVLQTNIGSALLIIIKRRELQTIDIVLLKLRAD